MNISDATPYAPYIIAEIGVNHEGDMDRAKRLIEQAAEAGANAAKFQSYTADLLAAKDYSPAYWDTTQEATTSQHELFAKLDSFGPDEYAELRAHCESIGVDFMSTPFDFGAVEYLNPMVASFKIASADITNVPLLRRVARSGKPVILSSGAASIDEVRTAIDTVANEGVEDITVLHCVLRYPTPPAIANLSRISTIEQEFGDRVRIGYSDHVPPNADGSMPALQLAATLGASVVEKHFTDDRNGVGNDHYHAMDADALRAFREWLVTAHSMLGTGEDSLDAQVEARNNARRRIFANRVLPAGHEIEEIDIIPLRSNVGLEVSEWDAVVGQTITVEVQQGQPILPENVHK